MSMKKIYWGGLLCLLAFTTAYGDELVIRDGFQTTRNASALQGRPLAEGGVTWESTPNLVVTKGESESAVMTTDEKAILAKVPLTLEADCVVLTAEVRPSGQTDDKSSWLGIGLGTGKSITWDGGLFFLLHDGGVMECYYCPPGKNRMQIKLQRAASVKPTTTAVKLSLQYQKGSNTLTVWVDDVNVIRNFKLGDFVPNLNFAGFSGVHLKQGVPLVTSFSMVITK
ncbi:MAG: hypothetical protein B9S32_00980 [Verrucomicrobia bacterium Tous-C9LFEB]|nr:MAG: hypothetical protein B9S32_00980 [Verrucomicrobia bacterium Tous-C9LFEB]